MTLLLPALHYGGDRQNANKNEKWLTKDCVDFKRECAKLPKLLFLGWCYSLHQSKNIVSMQVFHWLGPLGRVSHRVAMFVCHRLPEVVIENNWNRLKLIEMVYNPWNLIKKLFGINGNLKEKKSKKWKKNIQKKIFGRREKNCCWNYCYFFLFFSLFFAQKNAILLIFQY